MRTSKFRAELPCKYIKVARKILLSGYIKACFAVFWGIKFLARLGPPGKHRARMRKVV